MYLTGRWVCNVGLGLECVELVKQMVTAKMHIIRLATSNILNSSSPKIDSDTCDLNQKKKNFFFNVARFHSKFIISLFKFVFGDYLLIYQSVFKDHFLNLKRTSRVTKWKKIHQNLITRSWDNAFNCFFIFFLILYSNFH